MFVKKSVCSTGVGMSANQMYREDGTPCSEHEYEDRSIHFCLDRENHTYLYGVFDGHDGAKAAYFASQVRYYMFSLVRDWSLYHELLWLLEVIICLEWKSYFQRILLIYSYYTSSDLDHVRHIHSFKIKFIVTDHLL